MIGIIAIDFMMVGGHDILGVEGSDLGWNPHSPAESVSFINKSRNLLIVVGNSPENNRAGCGNTSSFAFELFHPVEGSSQE